MKTLISTPFADSRAADLSLAYGLPPLPALGTHLVTLPGARIELRVLGASHQVVLDAGATRWSETVACLPDRPGRLPAQHSTVFGPLRARFVAHCVRLDPARLAQQVQAVARRCEEHPAALVGTFPGSPLAITALQVWHRAGVGARHLGQLSWLSWHVYPQAGELVHTASMLVPR